VSDSAQGAASDGGTFLSDYVVEAANHDAAHHPEEAVNSLARGAKAGDLESMTRLGKRLIGGDSAPYLPREGVGLLIDAAKAGGAEAPAILAVLSAAGAHVRQSWNEGLSALVLAAERGWRAAQDQLRVLASDASLAAAAPQLAQAKIWKRLGQSVAAGPWHLAPARRELSRDPAIVSFPGLLTPAVCDWLVEQAVARLEPAHDDSCSHSAATFSLIDVTFVHLLVQARMAASCGIPIQNFEGSTILHCRPGQEFSGQTDSLDRSMLTFLAYLNDDYIGGETDFPELGVRHKGTKGEGLYFVDMRVKHVGLPPSQGDKWVVSQFVRSSS
jgi:prolyl 4-hydroxylase